jgi:hypothetical protein
MYRGYNLTLDADFRWPISTQSRQLNESTITKVRNILDNYIGHGKRLDASKMEEDWFPQIRANIFISHAHSDNTQALELSSKLYDTFGLTSFIDSEVWGYADDLLREIDNRVCLNHSENTYDYSKRNKTTSHVHMMLMAAIQKMIYNTECLILLNTSHSITVSDTDEFLTYSPWIYSELLLSKHIKKRSLDEYRPRIVADSFVKSSESIATYKAPLDHLVDICQYDLHIWEKRSRGSTYSHPLDLLYGLTNDR